MEINDKKWKFSSKEILVHTDAREGYAMGSNRGVSVFLNTKLDTNLILEGFSRGAVRFIQEMRKQGGFDYLDRIHIYIDSDDSILEKALEQFKEYVMVETQANTLTIETHKEFTEHKIDGVKVRIYVERAN